MQERVVDAHLTLKVTRFYDIDSWHSKITNHLCNLSAQINLILVR